MNHYNIEPMSCKLGTSKELLDIDKYYAQEKFDGHRAIMVSTNGKNYFFSRRNSDVTGYKEDNTDRLPYLHNLDLGIEGIFDGELVIKGKSNSSKVQHILGSTPERARELWESGEELVYKIFDVISLKGEDLTNLPLKERVLILDGIKHNLCRNMELCTFYSNGEVYASNMANCKNFEILLQEMFSSGSEGLVLKDKESPYVFKRSSSWLKYKKVNTADLVIMGFEMPKIDYTGKFSVNELKARGWKYWAGDVPTTKTYANGWVAGMILGAYKNGKLEYVTTCKGFSDEVQKQLKKLGIAEMQGKVVEVAYQDVISQNTKSLRHPRFKCFREDKNPTDCKWEEI